MVNVVHVTRTGANMITDRIRTTTTYTTEPKFIGWGTGGTGTETPGGAPPFTAAITDVGMFQEAAETRATGVSSITTTTTTNDTYTVTGTITSLSGQTITECGLFDATTKPPSNNVATLISSGATTSVVLTSGAGFASTGVDIQVGVEVMTITGLASNTLTVTRAANGTTAQTSIPIGEIVTEGTAPGQAALAGADLFLHASFTGLVLNTNDSINFTINTAFAPQ